jgi:methenyltetrahydromethanopterin cyclohydrolase
LTSPVNHTASLNWAVANAGELKGFELEKSKDGVGFSRLAAVPGERGKDSYSFTDESLYLPYTHYRLKIINLDGTAIYSDIIRLQNPFDKYFYKVYQNAEAHRYHLKIGLQNRATVSVRVADVSGKLVMKKDFGNVETNLDYNIDLAGKPAGIYFLNISISKTNYTVQLLAR